MGISSLPLSGIDHLCHLGQIGYLYRNIQLVLLLDMKIDRPRQQAEMKQIALILQQQQRHKPVVQHMTRQLIPCFNFSFLNCNTS